MALRAARLILCLVVLVACSTGEPTASTTSQQPVLAESLLTVGDLRSAAVTGRLAEEDVNEAGWVANPDPRGPCGARGLAAFDPAAFPESEIVILLTEDFTILHLVLRTDDAAGRIDAVQGDAVPGCEVFLTDTPSGIPQMNRMVALIDLDALGDDRIGWWSIIGPEGTDIRIVGQTALVAVGRTISMIQILSENEHGVDLLRRLAEIATEKLRNAG